jgi:uncharacterized protein YjbI with pentapeptide repeats
MPVNINNLEDCKNQLYENARTTFNVVNRAREHTEFGMAVSKMRTCMEFICKGIVFKKATSNTEALQIINRNRLHPLISLLRSENWIDDRIKSNIDRLKELGNEGTHEGSLTGERSKEGIRILKTLIRFFYILLEEDIPEKLEQDMNASPFLDERKKNKARYQDQTLGGVKLCDIYVEPNFELQIESKFKNLESVSNLHHFTNTFIEKKINSTIPEILNYEANLLLVLGVPGQGKTSFCKRLLADSISNDKNIFYKRLFEINKLDFLKEPIEYLYNKYFFNQVEEKEFRNSILILDGLDELFIPGGKHLNKIDAFMDVLVSDLAKEENKNFKVILTSRIGYLTLSKYAQKYNLITVKISNFNKQLQLEWIRKYIKVTHPQKSNLDEELIEKIHTDPNNKLQHFKELFGQPVLLHLFVLSDLAVDLNISRTLIYRSLYKNINKVGWAQKPKETKEAFENIKDDDLFQIAKDVALKMYTLNKKILLKSELSSIDSIKKFFKKINTKKKKNLYRYLYIAFYWEGKEEKEGEAIEFLHQSLQEFLVAEKIWDEIKELTKISSSADVLKKIWKFSADKVLTKEIKQYLYEIIATDEVNVRIVFEHMKAHLPNLHLKHFLHATSPQFPINGGLNTFYNYYSILMRTLSKINNQGVKLYLDLDKMKKVSYSMYDFGKMLHFFQMYNNDKTWNLSHLTYSLSLSGLSIQDSKIEGSKLQNSSLGNVSFNRTSFEGSDLSKSLISSSKIYDNCIFDHAILDNIMISFSSIDKGSFENISFKNGKVDHSNISNSKFDNSPITGVLFSNSKFTNCSFRGVDFKKHTEENLSVNKFISSEFINCDFSNSFFEAKVSGILRNRKSTFIRCDFKNARISNSSFAYAYINGNSDKTFDKVTGDHINFEGAELAEVSFCNAKLLNANFHNTIIRAGMEIVKGEQKVRYYKCLFRKANLSNANFSDAAIEYADFSDAILDNCTFNRVNTNLPRYMNVKQLIFKGAVLDKAKFSFSNFQNTNFENASLIATNLLSANLSGCNFSNCNFSKANFTNTQINRANFQNADLTDTVWQLPKNHEKTLRNNLKLVTYTDGTPLTQKDIEKGVKYELSQQQNPIDQLKSTYSLHNVKGLPIAWIKLLKEDGFGHLFELPIKPSN